MKANLDQSFVYPQTFYFKVNSDGDNKDAKVKAVRIGQEKADELHFYHDVIDYLCSENGFKYCVDKDGSCAKYVDRDGVYQYQADNYFIEKLSEGDKIYRCLASLVFDDMELPHAINFSYYDDEGVLFEGKSREIELSTFFIEGKLHVAKDYASWVFADGIMQLHNQGDEPICWGYESGGGQRDTAFSDEIPFDTQFLEDVIIPQCLNKGGSEQEGRITKPVVVFSSKHGAECELVIAYLMNDTPAEVKVMLKDYIHELSLVDLGSKARYTHVMHKWSHYHG